MSAMSDNTKQNSLLVFFSWCLLLQICLLVHASDLYMSGKHSLSLYLLIFEEGYSGFYRFFLSWFQEFLILWFCNSCPWFRRVKAEFTWSLNSSALLRTLIYSENPRVAAIYFVAWKCTKTWFHTRFHQLWHIFRREKLNGAKMEISPCFICNLPPLL